MAIITAFNSARMQEIEDSSVTAGFVDVNGHLLLQRRDGETIDAGDIRGPQGIPGEQGEQGEQGPQGDPADLPARLAASSMQTTDWNTALESGNYWSNAAALNNPVGNVASGQVTVHGDPSFPRVVQEVYFASDIPSRIRRTWRRTCFPSTSTFPAWTKIGQVPSHYKLPTAMATSGGTTPVTSIVDPHIEYSGCSSIRMNNLFLGDGDDGDGFAVFEFFWEMTDSAAATSSSWFLGLSGGSTGRSTLRGVYSQQTTAAPTPVNAAQAADASNVPIMGAITNAFTGLNVHGFVYNALNTAERTKIEFTAITDGISSRGLVFNSAITVDDGMRFGATAADRLMAGRFYCKRVN